MFKKLFGRYSIADFANEIIDEYLEQGCQGGIVWNAAEKSLEYGSDGILNLSNTYLEQKNKTAQDRKEFIQRYIKEVMAVSREQARDWEDIQHAILPRVRTKLELEIRHLYARSQAVELVTDREIDSWTIGSDLIIELVIDGDVSIETLPISSLKKMDVSLEQAKSKAMENLWSISEKNFELLQPGIWLSPWQDNYDACRILMVDKIQELAVNGDTLVFIPNRDKLIVVGSEDVEGLHTVLSMLGGSDESQRLISLRPYHLRAGQWQLYTPTPESPLYTELYKLTVQAQIDDYAEQKIWLEKAFEKEGKDVYVATYAAIKKEDSDEVCTWASWTDGVPTYLPKVDKVAMGHGSTNEDYETLGFVDWDQFQGKMSKLIKKTEDYPERYFVADFPGKSVLNEIQFADL